MQGHAFDRYLTEVVLTDEHELVPQMGTDTPGAQRRNRVNRDWIPPFRDPVHHDRLSAAVDDIQLRAGFRVARRQRSHQKAGKQDRHVSRMLRNC